MPVKKCLRLLTFFLTIIIADLALSFQTETSGDRTSYFPAKRVFKRLLADPLETQLSARMLMTRKEFGGNIGYSIGLIELQRSNKLFQLRLEGNTFLVSKVKTPDFPVQSTDYTVAVPFDFKTNDFSARLKIAHISSHLGDNFNGIDNVEDAIERYGTELSIFTLPKKYSKEYMQVIVSKDFSGVRGYGGFIWDFHIADNDRHDMGLSPLAIHYGSEWIKPLRNHSFSVYMAVDIKQRRSFSWKPDINFQTGFILSEQNMRSMRIGLELFNGYSNQGQFFKRRERDFNFFLAFDL